MAAIPSSNSLVATHGYYRRSTSSNSSCGSLDLTGEVIAHNPGLPKQDSGHSWSSFFFGKRSTPNGHDTQHKTETCTAANDEVLCIAKFIFPLK